LVEKPEDAETTVEDLSPLLITGWRKAAVSAFRGSRENRKRAGEST